MLLEKIIKKIGDTCSWLSFMLVILISLDVFLRYVFNFSSASLYELEWHMFAMIFLIGSSLTLQRDEHVRVDVFYNKFSDRGKEIINLIGNLIFLLPFCIIIFYTSIPFVEDSYNILESSPDPGGLPFRFIIKSIIPISFLLLVTQGLLNIFKNLKKLSDG
ncbi:MAG: TRAP transporter small permease subunit [Cytophagales bacterium]|jgi:TRAP-type mannitol/chloroaromatic compound transport system permease small subunit|nr:TRAP transporter small permease subunit [Cytophagales bacterium]PDH42844.1 MAG: C4-dicarboxylate ABC transporter permease [Rhodothermaeota bacterium MED-G19]|tara:strand:- start:3518 stop:4000 length:483 start_codon:yes stop_codon:yes gene_type:complete